MKTNYVNYKLMFNEIFDSKEPLDSRVEDIKSKLAKEAASRGNVRVIAHAALQALNKRLPQNQEKKDLTIKQITIFTQTLAHVKKHQATGLFSIMQALFWYIFAPGTANIDKVIDRAAKAQ